MNDNNTVDSSVTAFINAPIDKVDLPRWALSIPDTEYQDCSPAHIAAGATRSRDGKPMSINVEIVGGSLMVQHYVADIAERHHLRLVSTSDVFTPTGRTTIDETPLFAASIEREALQPLSKGAIL